MNGRFEEDLVQAAFGDLTSEQTAEVERKASQDSETARIFASYKDMSEGLKSLREVPDHQLSTERLRHAILSQGLAPRRSGWGFGWLLVPAGAVAMTVLGYQLLKSEHSTTAGVASRQERSNPLVVGATGDVASNGKLLERDLMKLFEEELSGGGSVTERSSLPTDEPSTTRSSQLPSRARSRVEYTGISVGATSFGPDPGSVEASVEGSGSPAMTADTTPGPQQDNSGIVVIEPDRDHATGANRATEVSSARNVVIGG